MKIAIILSVLFLIIGFVSMGMPGAALVYLTRPFINLIYGPYAFNFVLRKLSDTAWPLAIGITLVWAVSIIPAYMLTQRLFMGQSAYKFPQLLILIAIIFLSSTVVTVGLTIAVGKPHRMSGSDQLVEAAIVDDAGTIRRLAKQGVNVNTGNSAGEFALLQALEADRDGAVATLLDVGADPNQVSPIYKTPLWRACEYGKTRAIKTLLEHRAKLKFQDGGHTYDVLFAIGPFGDASELPLLAKAGADFKAREDGKTPLIAFLSQEYNGSDEKALVYGKAFLDAGVDINAQDDDGNSALHYAHLRGYKTFADELVSRGANPKLKNKKGETPEQVSAEDE